mgnify:CR=1 FL=1
MRATTNSEKKKRSKLHCPSQKHPSLYPVILNFKMEECSFRRSILLLLKKRLHSIWPFPVSTTLISIWNLQLLTNHRLMTFTMSTSLTNLPLFFPPSQQHQLSTAPKQRIWKPMLSSTTKWVMMSKLIQFLKLSYQASPTPQEAQQKLKSLISLLMDLKTAVLNHPKKEENHHNWRDGDCDNARPCRPCREKNSVYGRPRIWLRFKTCWSIPRCSHRHPNVFLLALFVPCCM